jgi:hypothetical protein
MKREITAVLKAHSKYEGLCGILERKIQEVCDFDAYLTHCAGDGHLVGNDATTNVAPLYCLDGKTKKNKLSAKEHLKHCI